MATGFAQLVTIYQTGHAKIEGCLNPQHTQLGSDIAQCGTHGVHAHKGTGSEGAGEQPRNALPTRHDTVMPKNTQANR